MTTDSKNLIEEIIDNAINPSQHDDSNVTAPDPSHPDSIKRPLNDPLNKNLVPDPDKP